VSPDERERAVEREVADLRPILTGVLPDGWDRPISSGDRAKLDAALYRAWRIVYLRALTQIRDQAAAEDVAQEVFCRVLTRLSTRDDGVAIEQAYLTQTARNFLQDQWRTAAQHRARDIAVARDPSGAPTDPEEEVLRRIEGDEAMVALDALPPVQRQVLRLRFVEGLTADEIAAVLDGTAGWVRQTQLRALRALRDRLSRHGDDPGGAG
jgi:RNA polymerase sigma-70 factor (ECF subfamily)